MSIASNCRKDGPLKDDELSIKRMPYTGDTIRIDGYYYITLDNYLTVYFLYRDGTILYGSTFPESELNEHEKEYNTSEWQSIVKQAKDYWGVLKIENNTIQFERWYPSDPPLKSYVRAGTILNDTTFIITESYRMQDSKKTEVDSKNETYYFKQFTPKPDSTNSFVE